MCPGLTSPGAKLCDVPANTVVAIMAEGKKHAVAVGVTTMSTNEMYLEIRVPVPFMQLL